MLNMKRWIHHLVGCLLMLTLCARVPLQPLHADELEPVDEPFYAEASDESAYEGAYAGTYEGTYEGTFFEGGSCCCNMCDGCGDAYRYGRVCQVAGGWVIGGVIVAVVLVAIFGKGCDRHHHHAHKGRGCGCK